MVTKCLGTAIISRSTYMGTISWEEMWLILCAYSQGGRQHSYICSFAMIYMYLILSGFFDDFIYIIVLLFCIVLHLQVWIETNHKHENSWYLVARFPPHCDLPGTVALSQSMVENATTKTKNNRKTIFLVMVTPFIKELVRIHEANSRVWLGRSSYARKSWKKWSDFGPSDQQSEL